MKKIGIPLFAALLGGVVAIGGYKLMDRTSTDGMSIEEKQNVYFASNPVRVASSGDVDFVQAAAAVTPAVVHIQTTYDGSSGSSGSQGEGDPFEDMFRDFFGAPRGRQQRSAPAMASGSGVIVSDDGYIVTNNHVVEKASKIKVILTDNRSFEAKVIGRDPNTDLALIKVNATKLPVVKLGNSDNVQVGEWVLAVGYPLSLQSTVTAGIVSAKGRSIGLLGEEQNQRNYNYYNQDQPRVNTAIESFIQTDAVINRGNSGGALVNTKGELIGINAAIASQTGYYTGYGFAIPINLAKKIMDDFIKFGSVKRGYIGITFNELNADRAKELGVNNVSGLYVQDVSVNGAAASAGIKKGDVITKVNGVTIQGSPDLQERVGRLRPGDQVQLTYLRGDKEQNVTVTLKDEQSLTTVAKNKRSSEEIYNRLGASFGQLNNSLKQRYKVSGGVVVTTVHRGGLFEENGIERGTVITRINGRTITKTEDIDAALSASANNLIRIDGITTDGARMVMSFPISK